MEDESAWLPPVCILDGQQLLALHWPQLHSRIEAFHTLDGGLEILIHLGINYHYNCIILIVPLPDVL